MAPSSDAALAPLPPVPGDLASPSSLRLRSVADDCGASRDTEHDADASGRAGAGSAAPGAAAADGPDAELDLEASVRCQREEVARLEETVRASEAELAAINAERRDVWAAVAAIRTCVLAGAAALGLERGAAAAGARAREGLGAAAGIPPLRLVEMHQGHVGAPVVGGSVTAGLNTAAGPGPAGGPGPMPSHIAASLLGTSAPLSAAGPGAGSPCLGLSLDTTGFAGLVAGGAPPAPAPATSEACTARPRHVPGPHGVERSPRPRPPPLSLSHAAGEDPIASAMQADDGLRTPPGSAGGAAQVFGGALQGGAPTGGYAQGPHQPYHPAHQGLHQVHPGQPSGPHAHLHAHAAQPHHQAHAAQPRQPHHLSVRAPGAPEASSSGLLGTPTAASLGTPSSDRDAHHAGALDDALAFDPASAALLGSIFSPVPDAAVSAVARQAAGLDMLDSPVKHLDTMGAIAAHPGSMHHDALSPQIPAIQAGGLSTKGHRRLFADETAAARSAAAARAAKMPLGGAAGAQHHGLSFVPDGFFEDLV